MDALYGYFLYAISLLTMGGLYAVLALGLNVQWGFTGLFNAGIAGFFAVGAYVSAILTTAPHDSHLGGYGMPLVMGALGAVVAAALIGWAMARICVRLRADYLAIATLGIAEILRLGFKNETWATNGPRGISNIPRAFEGLPEPWNQLAFMGLVLGVVLALYLMLERARISPWGRVMVAIREDETAAQAAGKDVMRLRVQGFVIGAAIMGLGGALMAQYVKFIGPRLSDPLLATFLVWVMLIAGGAANNRGAVLGGFLIWTVWSATEILTGFLPDEWAVRTAYIRIFLIGLALQIVLQRYPKGILPERRPAPGTSPPSSTPIGET